MYFEDLPEEFRTRIWENLRVDSDVCTRGISEQAQNEEIDDWINCNNNPGIIKDLVNGLMNE